MSLRGLNPHNGTSNLTPSPSFLLQLYRGSCPGLQLLTTNALSRYHMQANPTKQWPRSTSKRLLKLLDMSAAGDDLRESLIIPPASSSSSFSSHFNQFASSQFAPTLGPDTAQAAKPKAEITDMEVDYPPRPSTIPSAHAGDAVTVPMDGVMSLDDFLSANQEDHDAFMAAREEASAPLAKKSKTKSSIPVQAIAVGARSSQHTVRLHDLHQKLAIPQPVFTYIGNSVTKFTVEISFPGLADADELQGLKEEGRFNSKQEAKEASCKSALPILERLVEEGRITNAGKAKKPSSDPAHQQPSEKEEPGENFVGQLLGMHRQSNHHFIPY